MKKYYLMFLMVVVLAGSLFSGASLSMAEEATGGDTVTAYYFHGTFRCSTCQKMEEYSQEALETHFKDALASGKLVFRPVNVEKQENEHFVNDYQLYTKSLVLSLTREGQEVRSKNLDKIWEYVRHKDQYENYVRDETAAFLKEG